MKKNKRLLSLCLGLVLVLGVTACDDLGDILGDLGSDEPDASAELEEQDEDDNEGNDDTSESNISYTYSVSITNADELTPLVVEGEKATAKVELVTTTHNRVTHDVSSSTEDATAEDVTLESSAPGILEIEGLTINPIGAGTTVLTAYWSEHDATSSGLEITVSEPDSYTYVLTINNKESYTDLTTESNLDDVSITLTTYKNGVVEGTPETGSSETVSLVSSSEDVISVTSESLSLTVVGAGSTIITAYWIGHEDEESAKDTIAITVSEPTSGGGDTGGDTGDTGDEGGDTGGNEPGGDDDEPGGDEPETVYISTLTFDSATYELDLEENTTASFSVTALGPDDSTPSDPTAYSVEIVDTSVATIEGGTIKAVAVGTTTIKATSTDNPSDPRYGCASIAVTLGYEPVTSFSVSPETIELDVGGSVTLGYGEDDDYKVSYAPDGATKTSFTLSGTTDQYLTIGEKGTDNTYTITAPNDVEGAGAELRTYTLTITSDDPNSTASKDITVVISEIPEVAHPVTSITLSGDLTTGDTYTKTIGHTGSFTIGPTGSGADVIASVNEGAYDTSIKVSSDDYSYISISEPDENGVYTVTVTDTGDDELTATITIESAVNSSVNATLNLTISKAESRISSISIEPTSVDMLTDDSLTLGTTEHELTVTISDQYGEEVSGAEWEAAISSSSETGVISSIDTSVANQITIKTGSTVGTGYIDFSVKDHSEVESATLQVNVTQHYYDIDTIAYTGSEVTLTYNLGTDPVGSDVTISGENIEYSSTKGPVISNEADFALYTADTAHISISEKSITAVAPTEDAVTVYIYLVSDPTVNTTISVTVSDTTDYTPVSVDITGTTTDLAINEGGSTTISELGLGVSISPSYASQDYSVKVTTGESYLTASESGGVWTLTASEVDTDTICTVRIYANEYEDSVYKDITITIKAVMPTVITGYSVTFTFNSSLPSDAKLLMSATGTDVSVSEVTLGSGEGSSFTYTFTQDVAIGTTITYSLTIAYIDSDAPEGSEVSIGSYSATVHFGNNGTSKSDYTDINDTINTGVSLDSYLVDSTAETKSDITINFYFTDGTNYYRVPEYADAYIGGYYTNGLYSEGGQWTDPDESGVGHLTEHYSDEGGYYYYSYTFPTLHVGNVSFVFYFEYLDEEGDSGFTDWDHHTKDTDPTIYTISKYIANGSTISLDINENPENYISEPVYGGETEFYVFAFDTYNDSYYTGCMSSLEASAACFNGSQTATGENVIGTGTLSGDDQTAPYKQAYVYTKATAKYTSGSNVTITFSGTDSGNTIKITTGAITIPEVSEGKIAIYFCAYESGNGNFWTDQQGDNTPTPTYSATAWAGIWGGNPTTYYPDETGWVTNCSSLDAFIADLATITEMVH